MTELINPDTSHEEFDIERIFPHEQCLSGEELEGFLENKPYLDIFFRSTQTLRGFISAEDADLD